MRREDERLRARPDVREGSREEREQERERESREQRAEREEREGERAERRFKRALELLRLFILARANEPLCETQTPKKKTPH